ERRRSDAERVGPEVPDLRLRSLGREQPDAGALSPRVLGEHEPRAAGELERERRCLRALLAGLQELQPAGGHQVDDEDELAVLGREEQALAAALRATEATSLQCGERRVEGLQR